MSENLREQTFRAMKAAWRDRAMSVSFDVTWRAMTDAAWAVVGPELDRLRAEVERLIDRALSAEEDAAHWRDALGTAEAERDDLRARLADVWDEAYDLGWNDAGRAFDGAKDADRINPYRAALASVPEPSDTEAAPCRCHDMHTAITARHEGHCCFYPADRKCHPTEVEAWAAAHRALTEPAPDADREMTEAEKIVARFDAMTQEEHEAGIAAARERHPQFSAFMRRALSNPETKAAYDDAIDDRADGAS